MRKKRGVAIIVVLLVLSLLAVIAWAVTTMGSGNLVHGRNHTDGLAALYAAEAGAWSKIAELANSSPIDTADISGTMPTTEAEYEVEVYEATEVYRGFTVPANSYLVVSTGRSRTGIERVVSVQGQVISSLFDHAAFGATEVKLANNARTYSFSSSGGAAPHSLASIGTNNFNNGIEIATANSRVGGNGGNANVFGPPGSVEASVVSAGSSPQNYSAFATLTHTKPMDPFTIPLAANTTTDITGDLTIFPGSSYNNVDLTATNTLTLDVSAVPAGGVAQFRFESLDVLADSVITISPAGADVFVEVYVNGPFLMDEGSVVNDSLIPAKMRFFVQNGDVELFDKATRAYYTCYAPDNKITIKEGDLYGSVVADQIEILDGGNMHYDVDLHSGGGATGHFKAYGHRRY